MSRIGVKPIQIPASVSITLDKNSVQVSGSKGELNYTTPKGVSVSLEDNQLKVVARNNQRQTRAFHGLVRSLLQNMVTGVEHGYSKKLELVGTGYRAKKEGNNLVLSVGFSHPVKVVPFNGVNFDLEGETIISVSGIDKQQVGLQAANIRDIRKPEPYKGKGIRYQGEVVRRKAGKAAKVGA
jgi:large subunit ribosomal protein L6